MTMTLENAHLFRDDIDDPDDALMPSSSKDRMECVRVVRPRQVEQLVLHHEHERSRETEHGGPTSSSNASVTLNPVSFEHFAKVICSISMATTTAYSWGMRVGPPWHGAMT